MIAAQLLFSKLENYGDATIVRPSTPDERRNIIAGQKAMARAMLFPDPEKGGRGKKLPTKSKSLEIASESYVEKLVSHARAVYHYSPTRAPATTADLRPEPGHSSAPISARSASTRAAPMSASGLRRTTTGSRCSTVSSVIPIGPLGRRPPRTL
jgi:hypothetical protein